MPAERSRWSELAELMADHVLTHSHLQVLLAIVNHERYSDKLRHNCAAPRPGRNRLAGIRFLELDNFAVESRVNKWPFFG